jgi:hypothetical protein
MLKTQYSRVINKRTSITGEVPTIGPSEDHTDGSWIDTDIYPGEFYINMEDQKVWFGWTSGSTSGVTQIYPLVGPGSGVQLIGGNNISINGSNPTFTINYTGTNFNGIVKGFDEYTLTAGNTTDFTPMITDTTTIQAAYLRFVGIIMDTTTYDSANFESVCGWSNDGTGWVIIGGGPCVLTQSNIPGSSSIDSAFDLSFNTSSGVLGVELSTPANTNDIKVRVSWEYSLITL